MKNIFAARVENLDYRQFGQFGWLADPYLNFHLVKNKATDLYYAKLKALGVDDSRIFTTLASAYGALTSNQEDWLFVYPGDHVQTASLTWAKHNTNIQGMGSKNQRHQPSTLTTGAVRISCVTAAIANILNITGKYVQMFDIGTFNSAANTGNLTDIVVAGRNFYAERCAFRGGNNATQVGNALAGIPVTLITDAYASKWADCEFGSAGQTTRTTGPGFMRFAAASGGMHRFDRCMFQMRSETSGDDVSGFTVEENALDRLTIFNNCAFYNFSENWGALPDHMFKISQTSTFDILLQGGCGMVGFDTLSDNAHVKSSDPLPHTNAVEALAVATA